ncbi:hypothetical protein Cadr_000011441 [Camelus dromedarius]|uniref:Uncharacterized protein n=1 Tax=Camelus dromedarius TaxID=9838 RepID=A0A5N4DUS0_CAMDR|nr:hypothetical protein Cadr_000011441 [Camelus dromedarius]
MLMPRSVGHSPVWIAPLGQNFENRSVKCRCDSLEECFKAVLSCHPEAEPRSFKFLQNAVYIHLQQVSVILYKWRELLQFFLEITHH